MNYFVVYDGTNIIGFITDESQQAFLLEAHPNFQFIAFNWTDKQNPPMIDKCSIVNGNVVFIS